MKSEIFKRRPGVNVGKQNSILSYEESKDENKYIREKVIWILKNSKEPLSAREIAEILKNTFNKGNGTRAFVHPRITELCISGNVDEYGEKKDECTHRTVSVYVYREKEGDI